MDSFLTATILSRTPLTYSVNIALCSYLTTHTSDLALLLSSHREIYFSRFEYYTNRLTTFIQAIIPYALSSRSQASSSSTQPKSKGSGFTAGAQTVLPIPETFITNLIHPLFKSASSSVDESHLFCSIEFLDLITAVLELYIPQALNSKASLKPLSSVLECLLYIPDATPGVGLLERLISSKAGGDVLKKLMASKSTVAKIFNSQLLEFYTCRVTLLVRSCLVSHGTSVEGALSDWVEIVTLKSALEDFEKQLEAHNLRPIRISGDPKKALKKQMKAAQQFPNLEKMRALKPKTATDLRSQNIFSALAVEELAEELSTGLPPQGQVIEIPRPQLDEHSFTMLRRLLGNNVKSPQSVPNVQEALKTLRTLITFQILAKILGSFPCASCCKVCAGDVVRGKGFYDVEPGIRLPERSNVERSTVVPEIVYHIGGSLADKEDLKGGKSKNSKSKGKEEIKNPEELRRAEKSDEAKPPPSPELPGGQELQNILHAEDRNPESRTYDPSSMFPQLAGPWRVILSTQAMKDLVGTQHNGTFQMVKKILEELATGYWNRRSLTRPHLLVGASAGSGTVTNIPPSDYGARKRGAKNEDKELEWILEEWQGNGGGRAVLKLYKAVYGKNYRVLWGVECAWDDELEGGWRQIIKIWRIGDHKDILESIPTVLKTHKGYSNDYIGGCKLRQLETGKGKTLRHLPARFKLSKDALKREQLGATGTDSSRNKLSREEALSLHEALTTGKFYTLNEQMFESIQASKKCGVLPEFAFDMSEEETKIVKWWKSSVLILGRSGTGKTTCLVFKLLTGYLTRTGAGLEPRQIFLTKSPILAGKIARYIRRLIDSQLGRLDNPLLEVEQNDTGAHVIQESTDHDHDDADRNLFTIGKDSWPLVCTFDQFCGLLENTLKISDRTDFAPVNSAAIQLSWEHRRVDFSKFKRAYWPSFPLNLRKGISVELVFAEMMAVIKGGNYASDFLPLTKQSYLELSSRLAPTFLEGSKERESVWKMYKLYENRRRGLAEWDDLDRCRDIRKGLSKGRELLERLQTVIGECYVDEVQDLRVGEVEILLQVVGNPRGVHLAGDTAQCISRDSTFRFQDIKTLFFQFFGSMAIKGGHGSSKTAEESLEKPKLFLLAKNYRSHQGILALASSVVDLLWKVFPDVIDKLQPEVGNYLGPKPKLFIGFSSDMFSKKLFGAVDVVENIAEFGAEQVILVRDDEARNTLRDEIGTINLILTIVESKGMEFDDVLLFNYFSGSPAGPSFRALVSMEEEDLKTKQGTGLLGFDRRKHAVLSAELRGLYVAITRPRARLWLIEEHDENITAMARLWTRGPDSGLVDIVLRGDRGAADMMRDMRQGKNNTPADWRRKGLEFLEKRLWHPALKCFESAGDSNGQSLCKAHILEQKAIEICYREPAESVLLFKQAGALFRESNHPKQASKCFTTIHDWKSAAEVWSSTDHGRAALFYSRASLSKEAAEQYHLCENFEKAAAAYSEGQYFVDLLQYLIDHGHKMEPVNFRKFARLVNVLFRSQTDADKNLKLMAITLLGSDSEKEAFLVQYDMTRELIQHYLTTKQFMEAINTCLSLGDYAQAIQIIEFRVFGNLDTVLLDEIFGWTETRRLQRSVADFMRCEGLDITKNHPSILSTQKPFAREQTKNKWRVLERFVMDQFQERRVSADETKWNDIGEDLQLTADLLIVANGDYFGAKCDPREFPFQSFARCTEVLKKANKDGRFPSAVVRFYSVSYIKEDPSQRAWVLPPSPLLPDEQAIMMSHDSVFEALNRRLSDDMARSVYSLLDNAIKVLKKESLCEEFILWGSCAFQAENSCHSTHSLLSRDISLSRLELLNSSLEMVLCLSFPFQQSLFGDVAYAVRYRGTVRTWLEQLLISTTFVSEFTTHPLINIGSLYSNPRDSERGVRNALEELLYHRITRWKVNDMSFSLLLQQVDLADALNIGEIFGRNIISRIDWGLLSPVKTKPFGSFWDILRLRSALREGDLALVIELMWHIHPMQLDLDSPEVQYFHGVIGFWEQCCAFLIVISSSDEFLIKDNWCKIHLKYFFPCLVAFDALPLNESREIAEAAKTILASIARYVLGSLQKIQSCRYATLRMTWNKRPDILIRRVLDMLAICLCNMQQYTGNKIRPAPENEFLTGIIQAWNFWCRKKIINAQESELDINKFMVIFADAFSSSYSGIELLALYQKSGLRQPYSKFRIMRTSWKVKRGQFQSLSSFNKRSSEQKHPQAKAFKHERVESGHTDDGAQAALTKAEITAASMIQSFWKKYWPILVKRRGFEKTDEGVATKVMDSLCKTLGDTVDEVLPKKRLRCALLHELGVPIFVKFIQAEHSLDNTLSEMIVKMKAEDLKWIEREMLDENYQSLRQMREHLVIAKAIALDKKVVACPVEELRYRLAEVEALAMQIDHSMGDIMGEITRIEDQVAGRRASDSLKTPGEQQRLK